MRNKTWDYCFFSLHSSKVPWPETSAEWNSFIHPDIPADSGRKATSLASFLFYERFALRLELLSILCMRKIVILFFLLIWPYSIVVAKSYKFKYNAPRSMVKVARSTTPGSKMVEVVAYGRSADKAVDQASVDAIATAIFHGITGNDNVDNIPPILLDSENQYKHNKKFFDKFFNKGEFIKYVHRVNSTYPTGMNNIRTDKGRKVTILLIIDWRDLEAYLQSEGYMTLSSKLKFE